MKTFLLLLIVATLASCGGFDIEASKVDEGNNNPAISNPEDPNAGSPEINEPEPEAPEIEEPDTSDPDASKPNTDPSDKDEPEDSAGESDWVHCANEKELCAFSGTRAVRYGAGTSWSEAVFTESVECTNQVFGDPIPRTKKHCEYDAANTQPAEPDEPSDGMPSQPDETENTIAAGERLINEQRCAACHTDNKDGTFKGVFPFDVNNFNFTKGDQYQQGSQADLARYIFATMPNNDPSKCDQTCADNIAAYLWTYYQTEQKAVVRRTLADESYMRKAKGLLTGLPITAAELSKVKNNPGDFESLVREWVEHPNFIRKMDPFLKDALQSYENFGRLSVPPFILGKDSAAQILLRGHDTDLYNNLRDYAHKTFMDIVRKDDPFTEVVTTETWYMTTGLMSFLLAGDAKTDGPLTYLQVTDCESRGVNKNSSYAEMVNKKAFCIPQKSAGGIDKNFKSRDAGFMYARIMTASGSAAAGAHKMTKASDYNDWRKVTVKKITGSTPAKDIIPWYDVPRLRNADTIYVRVPRPGFFSSFPYLLKWRTNADNEFRVTVNQALIVALGEPISVSDDTVPFSDTGLDAEHASQPDCQACHQLLDPIRDYFMKAYDPAWTKPLGEKNDRKPSFSFAGHSDSRGDELTDLARAISQHPKFAEAWVAKLCMHMNSSECSTNDPEVQAVAEAFTRSDFSFKELAVALFSSDLLKSHVDEGSASIGASITSVSRHDQFCFNLQARMAKVAGKTTNQYNPCNDNQRSLNRISSALPAEEWARGSNTPDQPSIPDVFYYAGAEGICYNVALNKLGSPEMPEGTFDEFLNYLMEDIMGVVPGGEYYQPTKALLTSHYEETGKTNADKAKRFASVFAVGCSSPFLTAIDF